MLGQMLNFLFETPKVQSDMYGEQRVNDRKGGQSVMTGSNCACGSTWTAAPVIPPTRAPDCMSAKFPRAIARPRATLSTPQKTWSPEEGSP